MNTQVFCRGKEARFREWFEFVYWFWQNAGVPAKTIQMVQSQKRRGAPRV
jgi:hypothetical protein